ncbi:pyruvate kinase [Phreatobacter sp. AB_2022a]|uniref:pyruvate kinase n=1 Tax=Phreatobacter sp. AB_2022a TaxID=3003134 RepID=UPI002286D504|nr:pyruvate kinase [Phreatobacter sp. AB_2022a]MCZ0738217.1 pyruvate kinase [Phreatobacter sp. AB_2022a]
MKRHRRAKIVATLGPASSDADTIRRLFEAGVDVFRLNFSHGSHDDHRARRDIIRALEREADYPIAILQDLQGPKIRLGKVQDGKVALATGSTIRLVLDPGGSDAEHLPLPHPEIFQAIMPGHNLLIDDGKVRLVATGMTNDMIEARVVTGGVVSDRKGVNLPDTVLQLSPITQKDRDDLAFGLELGVDWVAFSFVQRPSDLIEAHQLVGGRAGVMAKIEKPSALSSIDDIITLADAVMVARGDLGVEIPTEDVPGAQKDLVRLCRLAAKPVIIATQMLESMIQTPTPTRAEASDVATAIYDGADAVMLSAESASGQYPVQAVETMDRIIRRTEQHHSYRAVIEALKPAIEPLPQHAVAAAAAEVADAIGAAAVVAFTQSGTTAYRIARQRSAVPILGLTPHEQTARRLALLWGTYSTRSDEVTDYTEMVDQAVAQALAADYVKPGETLVVVAGVPFGQAGSTNNLRVVTA